MQFFLSRWSSTCDLASPCHHPGAEIGYPQAYLGRNKLSSNFWQLCQNLVKFWSTYVQYLVNLRSLFGQLLVNIWLSFGQYVVNFWSIFGQTSGRGRGGPTTQETPWWAAHLQGYPQDHHIYKSDIKQMTLFSWSTSLSFSISIGSFNVR